MGQPGSGQGEEARRGMGSVRYGDVQAEVEAVEVVAVAVCVEEVLAGEAAGAGAGFSQCAWDVAGLGAAELTIIDCVRLRTAGAGEVRGWAGDQREAVAHLSDTPSHLVRL